MLSEFNIAFLHVGCSPGDSVLAGAKNLYTKVCCTSIAAGLADSY